MSVNTVHTPTDLPVAVPADAGKQMINRFDPESAAALSPGDQALLARRRAVLGDIYPLFYEKPVHVVRGDGVRLYDDEGLEYLDVYNNVPAVGHANPRIAKAVFDQLSQMNTHTRYLQDGVVAFAERYLATYPAHLDRVIFSNSGSEANDLAITIAQWRTASMGVIVTRMAYHGTTNLLAGVSPENGPSMPLFPWVRTVEAPDTFLHGAEAGRVFADSVREAIADLDREGHGTAALLLDTIMATDGIFPGEHGMLNEAFSVVRDAGGLVIADEVQPGMARTGEHMWGFQRHTDEVDIVTSGKPLAGGLPIGTLVLSSALSDGYAEGHRYFNTFGGNPASIAAANAVLDEIEDRDLMESARVVGDYLKQRIVEASASSAIIGDVRGVGFFIGVELVDAWGTPSGTLARRIVNGLRDARVLISAVGRTGQVLKVRPPLVFTKDDADEFVRAFETVLTTVEEGARP